MMSDNITATTDECMQFYQQPLMNGMTLVEPSIEGFMDATMSSEATLSPSNSHNNTSGGHQLTPKGGAFKPIRRRSRVSKRTPITLLKANTSNFRALVQQFTGCPTTTAMSLAIHKGPVTLNFQQQNKQQFQHHATRAMAPFGTINSNQVSLPLIPWQNLRPEQLPTSGNSSLRPISCTDVSDGLLFDNDFSLHQLSLNDFFME